MTAFFRKQHFLYFFPLMHGHGSLRPSLGVARIISQTFLGGNSILATIKNRPRLLALRMSPIRVGGRKMRGSPTPYLDLAVSGRNPFETAPTCPTFDAF